MGALSRIWSAFRGSPGVVSGEIERYSFSEYARDRFGFQGASYPLTGFTMSSNAEQIANSYVGYVQGIYKSNGVVFAVSEARSLLFSEVRFKFRRYGDPGVSDLFGTSALRILENPWPGGSTGDLLKRMDQDASTSGNFFAALEGDRLRRLRPDWVKIVLTAPADEAVESDIFGYKYTAGGEGSGGEERFYFPDQIVHWAPIPDPEAQYRGMSWLTPVLREIKADGAATTHKLKFFENAATPNLAVSLKETVNEEQFKLFMAAMNDSHQGAENAYKTLYLGGGADVTVVGADMRQLDFKQTQGAGETRIAAAGRVPPIIVGLSEGLQSATYSNYGQARRAFGDHFARPQWRSACSALSAVVDVPSGAELWYDPRDVAFLREDQKDLAEIQQAQAGTIRTLVDGGFEPDSVVGAILAEDLSKLVHSGSLSVQLQEPGTTSAVEVSADVQPELEAPEVVDDGV